MGVTKRRLIRSALKLRLTKTPAPCFVLSFWLPFCFWRSRPGGGPLLKGDVICNSRSSLSLPPVPTLLRPRRVPAKRLEDDGARFSLAHASSHAQSWLRTQAFQRIFLLILALSRATPFKRMLYQTDTSSSKPVSAEPMTLAVKVHEVGKDVPDMIRLQCCQIPRLQSRFAGVGKCDMEDLKSSDLSGLCLSSLQQLPLNRPFALQKHASRAAEAASNVGSRIWFLSICFVLMALSLRDATALSAAERRVSWHAGRPACAASRLLCFCCARSRGHGSPMRACQRVSCARAAYPTCRGGGANRGRRVLLAAFDFAPLASAGAAGAPGGLDCDSASLSPFPRLRIHA